MVVMGQKMELPKGAIKIPAQDNILRPIDIKPFDPSLLIDSDLNASSYVLLGEHTETYVGERPLLQISSDPKNVMTVSDKDSNYKVWIDRKRIVWTSDSTFTLKTRE